VNWVKLQLYKIGIRPKTASKGLFDMRLRKWKTIMASQNIISTAKQQNKDENSEKNKTEQEENVTNQL
jgi:hypothetical protein